MRAKRDEENAYKVRVVKHEVGRSAQTIKNLMVNFLDYYEQVGG